MSIVYHEYHCEESTEASRLFFSSVCHWAYMNTPATKNNTFRLVSARGPGEYTDIGRVVENVDTIGAYWVPFISCEDLPHRITIATKHGAVVTSVLDTAPGVGTYVLLKDPLGAHFALITPDKGLCPGSARAKAGEMCWYEYLTSNQEDRASIGAFYAAVAGWEFEQSTYHGEEYFMWKNGKIPLAGIADPKDYNNGIQSPAWIVYGFVHDLDESINAAIKLGGKVVRELGSMPGGSYSVVADSFGAAMGIYAATPDPSSKRGLENGHAEEAANGGGPAKKAKSKYAKDVEVSVSVKCSLADAFQAISSPDGFRGWWTAFSETTRPGSIQVGFGKNPDESFVYVCEFDVVQSKPNEMCELVCKASNFEPGTPSEWVGTKLLFTIKKDSKAKTMTKIHFTHIGMNDHMESYDTVYPSWVELIQIYLRDFLVSKQAAPKFR